MITTAFDIARQAGTLTVLNPSPWRPIASELLQQVDTLLLNEHEASSLFASPTDARAPAAAWLASRATALQKGMHWLDRIAGAMFVGFGLKLALSDNPNP